jgi:isochorismate hydrolase
MAEISKIFEKKLFSMMTHEVVSELTASGKDQVILCGIESHVCVMQTCLDLLERKIEVIVVADAASSQRVYNRTVALQRMQKEG